MRPVHDLRRGAFPGDGPGIGEVMHAAAHDDPAALVSRTTWMEVRHCLLRPAVPGRPLDIASVLLLQREAEVRGLAPDEPRP